MTSKRSAWLAVIVCAALMGCGDDGSEDASGAGAGGTLQIAGTMATAGTTGMAGRTGAAGTTGTAGRAAAGTSGGAGMTAGTSGGAGMGTAGASGGAGGASGGAGGARGGAGGASGGAFALTSTAFMNNAMLPAKHRCVALGGDTGPSPALAWTGAPAGAMSFAIAMTDTTAGISMGYAHWTIYDIPASVTMLAEGVPEGAAPATPAGAKQSPNENAFVGGPGYFGPCGTGGEFTYELKLYALDVATLPGVTASSTADQVRAALDMHDVATATLVLKSSE